jgi:cell pole-organizing protein PopZ
MSDSGSGSQVDDVLASVRRLVSSGARSSSQSDSDDEPGGAATAASRDGRLVLTPSLRVPDEGGSDRPNQQSEIPLGRCADQDLEQGPDDVRQSTSDRIRSAEVTDATARDVSPKRPAAAAEALDAKIAALQAAIARRDAPVPNDISALGEPDHGVTPRHRREAAPSADLLRLPPEARRDIAPSEAVKNANSTLGASGNEELRNLIAEVVREELQELLGGDLSRTVRKAVRREVRRALKEGDVD